MLAHPLKTFKASLQACGIATLFWFAPAARADVDVPPGAGLEPGVRCLLGAYALSDGRSLSVTGFEGHPHDLHYAISSGEYGHLAWQSEGHYALQVSAPYGSAAFDRCGGGRMVFHENGKPDLTGRRIQLPETDVFFAGDGGTRLHGKLVMPLEGKADTIVVWLTGSNDDPVTDDEDLQYNLPLKGIGVFVFDKRGTGKSQGEVSADFYVRAADAAAAVAQARKLSAETRHFGVYGGSQGGWVAPLTATKTDLDFVIVGYGLAEGVTAQDRDEVEEQVRNAGFGDDVMPKVREITDATARIVKSEWQTGYAEFAAVKSKYEREPWYKAIAGENGYTAMLLQAPIDRIKVMGPALDKHVSFAYDPRPVIETIKPRQLWVLGGADRTAPNTRTIEILRDIRKKRHDLDLVIYKTADHGIAETFQFEGVERHRYPAGMNDMIVRWLSAKTLPDNGPDIQVD